MQSRSRSGLRPGPRRSPQPPAESPREPVLLPLRGKDARRAVRRSIARGQPESRKQREGKTFSRLAGPRLLEHSNGACFFVRWPSRSAAPPPGASTSRPATTPAAASATIPSSGCTGAAEAPPITPAGAPCPEGVCPSRAGWVGKNRRHFISLCNNDNLLPSLS